MIKKPFEGNAPDDPRHRAGWEAEKEAAHFIDRTFSEHADVLVFHGLRLPAKPDGFFQIDHLILYRHGMLVIESKSVSGELRVDKLGQWIRAWRSSAGRTGVDNIADPLAQAERQVDQLRRMLSDAQPPLLGKVLGLFHARFRKFPIKPYVAISTDGRFVGQTAPFVDRVTKADRIIAFVKEDIRNHKRGAGLLSSFLVKTEDITVYDLTDGELENISRFLLEAHVRRGAVVAQAAKRQAPAAKPTPTPQVVKVQADDRDEQLESLTFSKCRSINVRVVYAKNYCIYCEECKGFSPLEYRCVGCGGQASVHKDGPAFMRKCIEPGKCGRTVTFWKA